MYCNIVGDRSRIYGTVSLLNSQGHPNKQKYSDHLPILNAKRGLPLHRLSGKTLKPKDFNYKFYLYSSPLDYQYELFKFCFDVENYPVEITINDENFLIANTEQEFIER